MPPLPFHPSTQTICEPLESRIHLTAGNLDPTFGVGGKLTTDFSSPLVSRAFALAPLPDGRVVTFAHASVGDASPLALAQFLPTGKIDPTFGHAGQAFAGFDIAGNPIDALRQPDGKLLILSTHGENEVRVTRFTSAGVIDSSFGNSGITLLPNPDYEVPDRAHFALALDGSIIVATRNYNPSAAHLLKISPDGKTIRTLAEQSSDAPNPLNISYFDTPVVAVRPDGRILLAFTFNTYFDTGNFVELAQYMPDGKPDLSFGQAGIVTGKVFAEGNAIAAVAFDNLGRILLLNKFEFNATDSAVARFRANGVLDRTFGTRGVTSLSIIADNLAVQPDGAVVLIAAATRLRGQAGRMLIERLTPAGTPDPAFGAGGTTRIDLPSPIDTASSLAVLPNGQILAAGSSAGNPALVRLSATGKPDSTYGNSAIATVKIIGPGIDRASSIVQQPDGKYIVSGESDHTIITPGVPDENTSTRGVIARYNSDGRLDPTFGDGGSVIPAASGPTILAANGKLLALSTDSIFRFNPNGSLDKSFANQGALAIAAGSIGLQSLPRNQFLLITPTDPGTQLRRYNADGSLDRTFGNNGLLTLADFTTTNVYSGGFQNAVVRDDGTIYLAGTVPDPHPDPDRVAPLWAFYRITSAGQIDRTFASNGIATGKVGLHEQSHPDALAIGPDGRIYLAGDDNAYFASRMAIARFNANGTLDHSFANAGILNDPLPAGSLLGPNPYPTAILIQPDNKILLLGPIAQESPAQPIPSPGPPSIYMDWGVFRISPDGSLDNDFGNAGHVDTPFGWYDSPAAALFTPDGKLIVAGSAEPPNTGDDFALARYILIDPHPITGKIENGILKITGTPAADVIRLKIASGKLAIAGMSATFATTSFSRIEITASDGNDTIDASAAKVPVTIDGGAGDDSILGGQSADLLMGNTGNDTLFGGSANDTLHGNEGNDYLNGGRGNDNIFGDSGKDQIFAQDNKSDTIQGGQGFDRLKADNNDIQNEIEGILA